MKHHRWTMLISGKVQGVSYRASAEAIASRLDVTGYVRNLQDGRVEIVAEGPLEDLDAFRLWCEEGPPAARVEHIDTTEESATDEFTGFSIR
jgi:acylphosphatase